MSTKREKEITDMAGLFNMVNESLQIAFGPSDAEGCLKPTLFDNVEKGDGLSLPLG